MFCRYCGQQLEDEALHCPSCGKSVAENAAPDFTASSNEFSNSTNEPDASDSRTAPNESDFQDPYGSSFSQTSGSETSGSETSSDQGYSYTYSEPNEPYGSSQSQYRQTNYQNNNPYSYNSMDDEPIANDRRGMAIASLVLGIISIISCCYPYLGLPAAIIALILGILSRKSSKKGMAIAGIILSSIGLLFNLAYIVIIIFAYANPEWYEEFYNSYYY